METASNQNNTPNNSNRKRLVIIAAIVAGFLLLIIYGLYWYVSTFISTDNAFVEGHIVYISSKVPGIVKQVSAKDNAEVKTGDLLLEIDDKDYAVRLEKAEKNHNTNLSLVKTAEAELKSAYSQVAIAESNLKVSLTQITASEAEAEVARANLNLAEKDLQRFNELFKKEFITEKQLDDAETKKIMAQKELERALSKVAESKAKLEAQKSMIKNLKTGTDVATANISTTIARAEEGKALIKEASITNHDTKLFSPFSGIIGRKAVEAGQFVSPGQPLMAIVSTEDVWIVANYKETQLAKVSVRMKVKIKADTYPDVTFEGVVDSISPASGAKFSLLPPENATGNFTKVVQRIPVKIKITNNDKFLLKPGMSVKTVIDARTGN